MYAKYRLILSAIFLTLVITCPSKGQETLTGFGKNRIQYKTFDWRYYSSENFDIYFYDGGKNIAKLAAEYLEDDYVRITDILGYAPYSKTKIFIYNSVIDLQQSNVGVNENNFSVGGQTNFVKSQVELAYPGTHEGFKTELLFKISAMLINDMMFGGSLTDMFQNTYLLNLPDWFLHGAALYIAEGWSISMDDYMRDLFKNKKVKKLTKLSNKDAKLAGQSIWNYIAEQYGRSNISNILNLTRIIRNEENSIANTLGIPFRQFLLDWQNYYKDMAEQVQANYISPPEESKIYGEKRKDIILNKVKISPDGNFLAYSVNSNGKYDIYIRELTTGNEEKIFSGGTKVIEQEVEENLPLISWKDKRTLGIVSTKRGKNILWLYDIRSNSKLKKDLNKFNNIQDISFSESGNVAVLSADIKGQNDIYLLSIKRNRVKRVTNDQYDNINPKFVPNTKAIIFASNRDTDSMKISRAERNLGNISDNYNLFMYDVDTTREVLVRITNTISKDVNPVPVDESNIYYLSDQKGIYNLFKYSIADSLYTQITNYELSIMDYDLDVENSKLSFTMLNKGKENVYALPNASLDKGAFTPQTKREEVKKAKFISRKIEERRREELEKQNVDDVQDMQNVVVDSVSEGDIKESTDIIDTDNYVFDKEVERKSEESISFLSRFRKLQTKSKIEGPFPYEPKFSADNIVVSWIIDPLIGFGIQTELEMNDMLENHKIYGGILATTNLKSGSVYGEYQYLKYILDFRARFERNTIFYEEVFENNLVQQRYTLNKLEVGASYPLSVSSRVSLNPFYAFTRYVDLDPGLLSPGRNNDQTNATVNYVGARVEYVFDNTLVRGLNIFEGTRGKFTFEHFRSIDDSQQNFSNLQLDIRHYQKISREFILATRLFYGRFMGNAPKSYLLGGMDNAIFNRDTDISGPDDPLFSETEFNNSDLLFNQYITNLRGFNYNKFNGENALLFNAELRLPIVRYFVRGPISSNFFRNLQFVGFYDLGSAWTGATPFSKSNSVNTEIISNPESPFEAIIKNFKNPWLQSYGAGVRTVLLGYYLKFDVAWPIEDYDVGSPEYYLTLGFDF